MHTVIVIAVIAGVAVAGFAALMALQPAWPLGDFRPGHELGERHYPHPPAVVIAAYRRAVAQAPGMTVADAGPDVLYVQVHGANTGGERPTVVRLAFRTAPHGGTSVRACTQRVNRGARLWTVVTL